ncbi:AAA family ATPase [Vibrio barjaei]|uniref:AAA family ATPase n=1 Tax=Vibrio barjaei TaxID=1676683 RepID=UPI002285135A|nr:ATP-binding protein [Vibrio barjaei]MCY9870463.1 ATP-binding protein [Vibrio barjaei]
MFTGRVNELKKLEKTYSKKGQDAKVIVYKGRRRVGKSTLVEFFMSKLGIKCYKIVGQPPAKVNRTTSELSNFAQQLSDQFGIQKPAFNDWDSAIAMLSDLVSEGNCVLMIDEINWLGKTHGDITTILFTEWESKLKHIKGFTLIMTGSLAGWILENVSESAGWYGRIALDETLQPLPLKDSLALIPSDIRKRMSKSEQIRYMLVSGGIPSYLKAFDYSQTLEDNLREIAYSKSGELYREFDTLMKDLFRAKGNRIKRILDSLSQRNLTAQEIAKSLKLDRPNGHLYSDLEMMQHSSFITPVYKWNFAESSFVSTEPSYVITDPYLRFYYKAIKPYKRSIEAGSDPSPLPKNLDSLLGLQFEYLMRENVSLLYDELNLKPGDVINAAPYQVKGLQIDWLVETKRYFYIIEFKFQVDPLGSKVIQDMDKKVMKLDAPKSVRTVIVHVNGVEDRVTQSAIIDKTINLCDLV